MRPTVFMFSGLGSQYFHMGRPLYDVDEAFRNELDALEALARPIVGVSLLGTIFDDRRNKADSFDGPLAPPALLILEIALARRLIALGVRPSASLGVSLGTYAAAVISGWMTPEAALARVVRQTEIVERSCAPGCMVAVLAPTDVFARVQDHAEVAAINGPAHFVISLPAENLPIVLSTLQQLNVACQALPVRFAYHSRWIEPARQALLEGSLPVREGTEKREILCCAAAAPLVTLGAEHFWTIARRPILFAQTLDALEKRGAQCYIDVGPSGTLAALAKYALPKNSASIAHAILSPFARSAEPLPAWLERIERSHGALQSA